MALAFAGCDNQERKDGDKGEPVPAACPQGCVTTNKQADGQSAPKTPFVASLSNGELAGFRLQLSDMPDLTRFTDYMKVVPSPGPITIDWWGWNKTLYINGTFQPRTTYKITVKAGLPMADGRKTSDEFRGTFTTGDRPPTVEFAAKGRYLPSAGARALVVKTVNVTNLVCTVRPVPTQNIVQLLAREENCYSGYWRTNIDSENTVELAESAADTKIRMPCRLNEYEESLVHVRAADGTAANGVYLVSAGREGVDEEDRTHRLVCVTDIGLSVRETPSAVYVWATSLTSGRPIKGIRAIVYGANNVPQGESVTDDDGWCCCELPKSAKPFAVVATTQDETDTSFLALRNQLDETLATGGRRELLAADGVEAFVWTDRGIYRHGEPILVHAILRNGNGVAPRPFPVEVRLEDPDGRLYERHTLVSDARGAVTEEKFSVPDDRKSGTWTILICTPGTDGATLGFRNIKIEEFVPPQIRVKVEAAKDFSNEKPTFVVSAEHLFGGPAKSLPAEGAVMFSDAPFAPKEWKSFRFGDERRRLTPNFTVLPKTVLDAAGRATFTAELPAEIRPRAAMKMTAQGSVFENGGRPVSARFVHEVHAYPFYIGVALPETIRRQNKPKNCRVVLVRPNGKLFAGEHTLAVRFERVDWVYGLKRNSLGNFEWSSDKIRMPMGDETEVKVAADGTASIDVPANVSGDCIVTLADRATDMAFSASYWVSGDGDDASVRTSLENPSRVTLTLDKDKYYVGDVPRLTVKAPFAGMAWLQVLREDAVYSQVVALTNATSELLLQPVTDGWTPGVDVALTVVQAATAGRRHAANRAYGLVPLKAAKREAEFTVKVEPHLLRNDSHAGEGSAMRVRVACKEAASDTSGGIGAVAVVTVVDEGINILTDEPVPDPIDWFGATRDASHPFHDLYNFLLPIEDGRLKRSGVKTGGGAEGDLFRRISPTPNRRFKPLSLWRKECRFDANGNAWASFDLGEFVGEVRVTAVAYDARATGSAAEHVKVAPKVVMQPDAPRFAAPGDVFDATLTLSNRSGSEGTVTYDVMTGGAVTLKRPTRGQLKLAQDASETLRITMVADNTPGEGSIVFVSEGMGEKHRMEIHLPIRPAAAWRKTSETVCIQPGETKTFPNPSAVMPEAAQRTFVFSESPVGHLAAALAHLVEYPYGCLEQTVSRVFPLVSAGGLLNTLPVRETSVAGDAKNVIDAGLERVLSMVRMSDFVMWPDCSSPPWEREVSLWAAHFLIAADKAGFKVPQDMLTRVKGFLRSWAMDRRTDVSAYACHTLTIAGTPDADRMLHLYDRRAELSLVARCRLARAFVLKGDRDRATELTKTLTPDDVKSASWAVLAMLELDPKDSRLPAFVQYLADRRDVKSGHWETTEMNAHALLALSAYYRMRSDTQGKPELSMRRDGQAAETMTAKKKKTITGGGNVSISNTGSGTAYVTMSCLSLPDPAQPEESNGIGIERRFLGADGKDIGLNSLTRGDLAIVELTLKPETNRDYADLVVEDLLPACFEPDTAPVTKESFAWLDATGNVPWELRRDIRDDRVQIFSRKFRVEAGKTVRAHYAVRVVSAGTFVLPGTSVEAMYAPNIRARGKADRITVEK